MTLLTKQRHYKIVHLVYTLRYCALLPLRILYAFSHTVTDSDKTAYNVRAECIVMIMVAVGHDHLHHIQISMLVNEQTEHART